MLRRITMFLALMAGLALLAGWLLLSSNLMGEPRRDLAQRLLTRGLGQEIRLDGGVRVNLGLPLRVSVQGLALPSRSMSGTTLAAIDNLEFDLTPGDLLKGRIRPGNIHARGTSLTLSVDKDGTSSWAPAMGETDGSGGSGETDGPDDGNAKVADFLADRDIRFTDTNLTYRDARNGLEFDLLLASLELDRRDGPDAMTLTGDGTLNGQALSLTGSFPTNRAFRATASFSGLELTLEATPEPDGSEAGHSIALSADIADLGQLLDLFRLQGSLAGSGRIGATFRSLGGGASLNDLDVRLSLDGGQSIRVTGDLGMLDNPDDVTIYTSFQLYPADGAPPATQTRRDLKLIAVDMDLIARPGRKQLRRMVIKTNGFTLNTGGEGPPPISVSGISRTADGLLRLGKLTVNIGPPKAPALILQGPVGDALRLRGIDLKGTIGLPAANLLAPDLPGASDVLGNVTGTFRLGGDYGQLGLSDLTATTRGSDLWTLTAGGAVENVFGMDGVALDIAAEIPSGGAFLDALGLKPVETGRVAFTSKLTSRGADWNAETTWAVAQSRLDFNLGLTGGAPDPVVRGRLDSDLIKVEDLRDIVAAMLQLARLKELELTDAKDPARGVQAGDPERTGPTGADARTPPPPDLFSNVSLQPLGTAILMPGMDLDVAIDMQKIAGLQAATSIRTDFAIKDRQARFGPLKFEYGGGYFDLSGSMDLRESPDILRLSGSAGGWDFATITRELGFRKFASGTLNASIDISGNRSSVDGFLGSMQGTTTVSMKNGSIDSQLLDLAGLGAVPWLFSDHRRKNVTIVCLRAPLRISGGRVSSKQTVLETSQVQIVVQGSVDLKNKTLDIKGQPRRIGKPLSRSPWPFTAAGSFAKPRIKLKDGPRRLRRTDGASTMPQRRKTCIPDILQLK